MPHAPLTTDEIVRLFNESLGRDHDCRLVGGFPEPLYVPSRDGRPAELRFTADWTRSVLHEVSHWCVAGRRRRALEDYGYWYDDDGRPAERYAQFFTVEDRPQAVEWVLSLVAGAPFTLSLDNTLDVEVDWRPFEAAVRAQFESLARDGLPPRARRLGAVLNRNEEVDVATLWREHGADPIDPIN